MSRIRSGNTQPEMRVRSLVHGMGFRYRLHRKDLPGKPDLVFPGRRKIILVHGCFWHMHDCPYGRVRPRTNAEFWEKKRQGNVVRDASIQEALERLGWRVQIVWECRTRDLESLAREIEAFLATE